MDLTSVVILKTADRTSTPVTVSAAGVATYTADTRYTGSDTFSYTIDDTSGNTSRNIGTVNVQIASNKPATADPRFIYSSGPEVFEFNGGVSTSIFTVAAPATVINALATNRDDNLIYFAEGTAIYAYDYIAGTQFTVIADITADARFTGATSLSSGGATYINGVYYLVGDGATTGYYRITMTKYVPGSFAQGIRDVTFLVWSDGLTRDMGDIQIDCISRSLIIIAGAGGTSALTVSTVDADSGQVLRVAPIPANNQIAMGCDGVLYVADAVGTVNSINANTGAYNTGNAFPSIPVPPFDLAEWISQPC